MSFQSEVMDVIRRANTLLKEGSYRRPERSDLYVSYLAVQPCRDVVIHCYEKIPNISIDMVYSYTVIIHGHEKGVPCAAPFFCHEYGYRPDETQFPEFHRVFYQKWPQYGQARNIRPSAPSSFSDLKLKL
jgi:hypothetical protein